ncbi:hypothetical protein EUTSA_v10009576mg [Eutrema salsugineum]|uniref:Leucine-rich repeat-containing N-terminal plant-type domain-containing protein n=1 Tax=Eutrema salsugineum TaxID=72664 RepID=V4KQ11_EUTSA|nr:hypothetical protein EUTSA_v10009576mg [Eutrema salsugineum]
MNSFSFTIVIFAAIISLHCLSSTGEATCHPDDEAGLLAFKSGITRDPVGLLNSWKKGTKCCSWFGDTSLGRGYLGETISPLVAKLQHLEDVSFTYLKITGSFPQFLFHLPNLTVLRISGTRLSGPPPPNIGALRLTDITIDDNQFTGLIPSFSWRNHLSGTIPNIFNSMTKLTALDLSRNRFSRKLPLSIPYLAPTLTYLDLSQNNLSGTIPSYLSRFHALSTFDLSRDRFFGVVPMSFANMTSFFHFRLSQNLLTGTFPALKFVV